MCKFLFLILLIPQLLHAQKLSYIIKGNFDKEQENKFVYLYTQKVDDKPEELLVLPIIDNQFLIKGDIDRKGRSFSSGIIFLGKNDKISLKDFDDMKMDPEFYINEKILFILEDSLHIDFKSPLNQSIVHGGKLNAENVILQKELREGSYLNFINNHLDSPFSILCLKAIDYVAKYSNKLYDIDIVALFNGLSERVKQSFEGKEFAKKYIK